MKIKNKARMFTFTTHIQHHTETLSNAKVIKGIEDI